MGRKNYMRKFRLQFMLFHYLIVIKIQEPQENKLDSILCVLEYGSATCSAFFFLNAAFVLSVEQNYLEKQQKICRKACDS